ncbi:M23 family metallopeptidase [Pelagibacteraceae bacterium]|nr:M23 family metallopeptidase [Pelagibacteraceae bacterium]
MFRILRYLILISLISSGYYLFISEYLNISDKYFFEEEIVKKEIVEDKKEIIQENKEEEVATPNINKNIDKEQFVKKKIEILQGDTFVSILENLNFKQKKIYEIISKIEESYDLKKIKTGEIISVFENNFAEIKKIEFFKNNETIISVNLDKEINLNIIKLTKNSSIESKEYTISESLFSDGIKNDVSSDILVKIIRLFSFDLDFQRDIRVDTVVSISYEFDEIVETGRLEYNDIKYASIIIDGKQLEYFKFITDDGYVDYFNREGKNVKKSILKTPLDGARISSNFGMRKHPISGFNKMHKGVDFAAPTGTPIYAGGNGIVEYVGRNGGYGKYIRIRHNNGYKTAYAHLSNYKKGISKGVRVNQGEVIGYVGSTGNSTGPHLHYEIIYQNKHINPLKLKLPSGKILKGKELEKFKEEYKIIYADHLSMLYE